MTAETRSKPSAAPTVAAPRRPIQGRTGFGAATHRSHPAHRSPATSVRDIAAPSVRGEILDGTLQPACSPSDSLSKSSRSAKRRTRCRRVTHPGGAAARPGDTAAAGSALTRQRPELDGKPRTDRRRRNASEDALASTPSADSPAESPANGPLARVRLNRARFRRCPPESVRTSPVESPCQTCTV